MRNSLWIIPSLLLVAAIGPPCAHADSLTDPNGILIFPDGSVITSNTYVASTPANGFAGITSIVFQFPGGTGGALNRTSTDAGEFGGLVFTEPVSNASIHWEDDYGLYMNFFSYDYGELGSFTEPVCATYPVSPCSGVVSFANPGRFEMTWDTFQAGYSVAGYGGISSLSYTLVPEPGTAVLLLTGIGLLGSMRRKHIAPMEP